MSKKTMWCLVAGMILTTLAAGETFGASDDAIGPLGGGDGYIRHVTKYDHLVKSEQELLDALKKAQPGQVVYVEDGAELDFSPWVWAEGLTIYLPEGVTLASGRGKKGSSGALICSSAFDTKPLFMVEKPNVRITGIRLQGPDPKVREEPLIRWDREGNTKGPRPSKYWKFPFSTGIESSGTSLEVDNCEIWAWSLAGIYVTKGCTDAHIHHCNIHHNQRAGLGYGIAVNECNALIESNLFDYNRHSIESTGAPGSCYEACNNIVGPNIVGQNHCFDMHGGRDRGDGTRIAGDWVRLHHNTFQSPNIYGFAIRGVPQDKVDVHHNWFLVPTIKQAIYPYPRDFYAIGPNQFGPSRQVME
jgi:parallel beta helix pectate lyase-like protein